MAPEPQHHVTVRKATTEDIDFLAEVLLQANAQRYQKTAGWNAPAFLEHSRVDAIDHVQGKIKDSITYVIESEGMKVGRLRVVRTSEQLEIAGIQLLPEYHHRGIGTLVITTLMQEGKSQGLPTVLEVENDNPDARRLYLRLGFEQQGEKSDSTRMIARHERQGQREEEG